VTGGPKSYVVSSNASGVTPGTYGSASLIPSLTVDTFGRVTAVTTNAPADAGSMYAKALLYNTTNLVLSITVGSIPAIPSAVEVGGAFLVTNGWSFGPTSTADLSMGTDGRIRYTGSTTKTFLATTCLSSNTTLSNGIKLEIRKNGSNAGLVHNFYYTGDSSGVAIIPMSVAISLSTNDYVSIFIGALIPIVGKTVYCASLELINA